MLGSAAQSMQAKDLRSRFRFSSFRQAAKPVLYLAALAVAGASCAAELEDPDRYKVASGQAQATGGIPVAPPSTGGTSQGGTTGMTGGSTGMTGGSTGAVTLDACVKTLFMECTICHSTAAKSFFGDLDLSGDDVIARLKDLPATNKGVSNPASCTPGQLLINSANPAESVLLKRVKKTQSCGTAMPDANGLSGAKLTCLEAWVNKF